MSLYNVLPQGYTDGPAASEDVAEGEIPVSEGYLSTPTSTPTSLIWTNNKNIIQLVEIIGHKQLSVKEIMKEIGLKNRENFMEYSLKPAMAEQFVQALYPDKPHHPRQKYLLSPKGLTLLESFTA